MRDPRDDEAQAEYLRRWQQRRGCGCLRWLMVCALVCSLLLWSVL